MFVSPFHPLTLLRLILGMLALAVCNPTLLFAQSGPSLSYSTYLPTIHFNPDASFPFLRFGRPAILSVDSSGAACVTDGISLYGYDANGNVTFTVPDTVSVPPKIHGTTVFRDGHGNCFIAGNGTTSTPTGSLPLGVAKFSSTGSLLYADYFGGNAGFQFADADQIVAASLGNAYVVGQTNFTDFPVAHAIQNLLKGHVDAYILKLDPTGSSFPVYSTYFGQDNLATAIAVDAAGNAYITGATGLASSSIPVTPGVFQGSPKSVADAWVAKIDPNGNQVYGTYLGGSAGDDGLGIAVDTTGSAYVVGGTCSTDFPAKNAFQSSLAANCAATPNSDLSAFVSKLSPDGSTLIYSTFLGGSDGAQALAIALDSSGNAYVTGTSSGLHFPLLNPIQSDFINTTVGTVVPPAQVFVTAFNSAGSGLQYSTFFGGFNRDFPTSIGVDAAHNVYIGGGNVVAPLIEGTNFQSFPIVNASNGVFQPFLVVCQMASCASQGFLAKISPNSGTVLASPSTVDFGTVIKGMFSSGVDILVANMGSTDITINSASITGDYAIGNNTCPSPGTLLSSKHCEVGVIFGPTAGGTRTGVLTLTSNAPDSPRNIQLTGIGGVPIVSLNPTSLNLTSPSVGTAGPAKTVKLSNTGADILNITSLTITGTNAADFSETHDCASTLGAGLSCNVNITYKASTPNTETASLQFVDNAAGSPHTVPLTGTISPFGLTIAPGSSSTANVSAGQMATYGLMIGGPGFGGGNVTLSCSGAPAAATCNVPSSESVGSTAVTFQATVNTTARSTAIRLLPRINLPPVSAAIVVLFGILAVALLASRRKRVLIALAFVSLYVILMASCGGGGGGGGGGGSHGTPSGTFTIVVTATNGSTSQSMNLTLNVN